MVFAKKIAAIAVASSFSCIAFAEVSSDEAKQLGGPVLTVIGSEKSGNKEGTIPEYGGQQVKIGVADPKRPGQYTDPFGDEKPLFTITAQNADKYADKLDGQIQLFKKYPNYRMDVYPTHRTVVLPKYVVDNTLKNATSCKGVQNGLVLEGCYGGIPFPIPKNGNQMMWNHLTAYEGYSTDWKAVEAYLVPQNGPAVMVNANAGTQSYPTYDPNRKTPNTGKEIYWRVYEDFIGPARVVGQKIVLVDALDSLNFGRRVYVYIPGQRRVKLSPDLQYDTPSPTAGGGQTMDDAKLFLGAQDRFDFKLVGKKEKFIIANDFKGSNYKACPGEKLMSTKYFPNPDCVRYELHRVWVVEATLKPQFRHVYKKRKFFFDEDGYGGGTSENYDAAGALYRLITIVQYPFPDGGANYSTFYGHDLLTGMYVTQGMTNVPEGGYYFAPPKPETHFSPESLAGTGIR